MLALIPQPRAGRHLCGVEGATTLNTPGLREIRANIIQLVATGGIILIDGKPGVGKTFGAREILASLEVKVHWADMPHAPKGKEAIARIYSAVTGRRPKMGMTEYELTEDTVDILVDHKAVLVIDEAQNMTVSALRAFRYIHDRPTVELLLVLIGSGVMDTVRRVPELDSRVSRRTTVQELNKSNLLAMLRDLHPMFSVTGEETLVSLAEYAKGNLRNWARILEVANRFEIDVAIGINSTQAKFIIRSITGRPR